MDVLMRKMVLLRLGEINPVLTGGIKSQNPNI